MAKLPRLALRRLQPRALLALGALAAHLYRRRSPAKAELYTVPVASGLIAGESLTGVLVAGIGIACMHVTPPNSWKIFFLEVEHCGPESYAEEWQNVY